MEREAGSGKAIMYLSVSLVASELVFKKASGSVKLHTVTVKRGKHPLVAPATTSTK